MDFSGEPSVSSEPMMKSRDLSGHFQSARLVPRLPQAFSEILQGWDQASFTVNPDGFPGRFQGAHTIPRFGQVHGQTEQIRQSPGCPQDTSECRDRNTTQGRIPRPDRGENRDGGQIRAVLQHLLQRRDERSSLTLRDVKGGYPQVRPVTQNGTRKAHRGRIPLGRAPRDRVAHPLVLGITSIGLPGSQRGAPGGAGRLRQYLVQQFLGILAASTVHEGCDDQVLRDRLRAQSAFSCGPRQHLEQQPGVPLGVWHGAGLRQAGQHIAYFLRCDGAKQAQRRRRSSPRRIGEFPQSAPDGLCLPGEDLTSQDLVVRFIAIGEGHGSRAGVDRLHRTPLGVRGGFPVARFEHWAARWFVNRAVVVAP